MRTERFGQWEGRLTGREALSQPTPAASRTNGSGTVASVLAAVTVAAMLLASCGGATSTTTAVAVEPDESNTQPSPANASASTPASKDTTTTNTATSAQFETRPEILQLARPLLDGTIFNPDAVAGSDVLLWFWAPW